MKKGGEKRKEECKKPSAQSEVEEEKERTEVGKRDKQCARIERKEKKGDIKEINGRAAALVSVPRRAHEMGEGKRGFPPGPALHPISL